MTNINRYRFHHLPKRQIGTYVPDSDLSRILGRRKSLSNIRMNMIKGEIIESKRGRAVQRRKNQIEEVIGLLYDHISKSVFECLVSATDRLADGLRNVRRKKIQQIVFTLARVIAVEKNENLPVSAYNKAFGGNIRPSEQIEALALLLDLNLILELEDPRPHEQPVYELAESLAREAEFFFKLDTKTLQDIIESFREKTIVPRVETLRAALIMVNSALIEVGIYSGDRLVWIEEKLPYEYKGKAKLIDRASMRFRSYHGMTKKS